MNELILILEFFSRRSLMAGRFFDGQLIGTPDEALCKIHPVRTKFRPMK